MARSAIVMTVVGCLLLFWQPVYGQQVNRRVELLKKELELAKKECELARKENDALRKENEQLKKEIEQLKKATDKKDSTGAKADKEEKPSGSADGVNYVVDKVARNGTRVTLHLIATNSKADCMILPSQVEARGIEPRSRGVSVQTSTCVAGLFLHAGALRHRTERSPLEPPTSGMSQGLTDWESSRHRRRCSQSRKTGFK
jgi:regulator of replication initiation timing